MVGDAIFYTDDELNDVVYRICKEQYNGQKATLLGKDEKLSLAKVLHFDYNADNAKIARLLRMPVEVLAALFPLKKK